MTVEDIITRTIKREGGYVNNPKDPGGETNFGITKTTALRYGYTGSMKEMRQAQAYEIYKGYYWIPAYSDIIHVDPDLTALLFDVGVNMGVRTVGELLQKTMNLLSGSVQPVDGVLGAASIQRLRAFYADPRLQTSAVVIGILKSFITLHYAELVQRNPKLDTFFKGWMNRLHGNI